MAPQHIHLHIGAPKTGSTAIQRWLFEHRADLAAAGLLYPEVCLRGYGHHDLAFLIGGGYPEWASPQPLGLGVLQDQLRQAGALGLPQMLLSSEDFFLYQDPDRLRAFIEGALGRVGRFTVHAYLRRQQEVLPSWYNQLVKAQGYAGSFED